MKTLLVFALAVHVTIIIVQCKEPKFGDIVSFPRKCTYKHFALYVGNEYPGQGDIFHQAGKGPGGGIKFGQLENEGAYKVDNYLDLNNLPIEISDAEIKIRIEALTRNPGNYDLLNNNCEHAATYLRYGLAYSKQHGTLAQPAMLCRGEKECPEWKEAVRKIKEETQGGEQCASSQESTMNG